MQLFSAQTNCAPTIPVEPYELKNLAAILRHCRLTVCEAYLSGKHDAALAALAAASIRLYRYVENGSLIESAAHETLWDVADNLTLTKVLGEDAVAARDSNRPAVLRSPSGWRAMNKFIATTFEPSSTITGMSGDMRTGQSWMTAVAICPNFR